MNLFDSLSYLRSNWIWDCYYPYNN